MSERKQFITIFNVILGVILLFVFAELIWSYIENANGTLFVFRFIVVVAVFFPLIVICNKIINGRSKVTFEVPSDAQTEFTVAEEYRELYFVIRWSVAALSVATFDYGLRITSEAGDSKTYEYTFTNLETSGQRAAVSAFVKDSQEIVIKNPQVGKYTIVSNKLEAPEQFKIKEIVRLYK